MSINGNVNKQMLLEICSGINNDCGNDRQFLTFFDNICDRYQTNRFEYSNLQEINKNILEELVYYLNQRNEQSSREEIHRRNNNNGMIGNRELKTIDAIDLKVQKDEGFSMKLKTREEAFKTLIEKPPPPAV